MARTGRGLILAVAVLLLCSCTTRPLFLLFLDTYSAQTQPDLTGRGLPAGESETRFRTETVVRPLGPEAEKDLRGMLSSSRPAFAYLSGLFNLDADRLAAEFPDTTFVVPGDPGVRPGTRTTDWIGLWYDYPSALRKAGLLVARLSADPAVLQAAGTASGPMSVGVLVSESAPWLQDRVTAFGQGLADGGGGQGMLYRQVESANDRVRARQLLEEMRQQGAGIFLLLTYSLTGFCLEYVQKQGALAIVQDAAAAAAYPDTVILYLEEDSAAVLGELLRRGQSSSDAHGATGPLVAPVRLRPGPVLEGLASGGLEGVEVQ